MSQALMRPTSWWCRECGQSNGIESRTCGCGYRAVVPDSSALLELLARPTTQVSTGSAGVVHNHVYNISSAAGDVNILHQEQSVDPSPGEAPWTFFGVLWAVLKFVGMAVVAGVGTAFGILAFLLGLCMIRRAEHVEDHRLRP